MAKHLGERLLPPDDPIFSGGVQTFSVRRPPPPQVEEPTPPEDSEEELEAE